MSAPCIVQSVPPPPEGGVWPVVIVGAGAAGLMAGVFAGRCGVRALLLESRPKPGAKIRVSGGGRCNVLPSVVELDDFATEGSRNALKNVLASWPLKECRAFFERDLGIPLKVEDTGKVFPVSDDPAQILDALFSELGRNGAQIVGGVRAEELTPLAPEAADGARFELQLSPTARVRARSVVLATGGLSLPKTGSDGWGYTAAHKLGHTVLRRYPALVPLASLEQRWAELAGISLPTTVSALRGEKLLGARTGDFLFTHKGFSGPVVLDQSRLVTGPDHDGVELAASWLGLGPAEWDLKLQKGGARSVLLFLRDLLPRRMVSLLIDFARVPADRKLSEMTREERRRLVHVLGQCPLSIVGDEGYRSAEVTGGGVALDEVSTKTLESRLVPGLYFCGEVLDVIGRIGGFNFLWAWVTGRKVGLALAAPRGET
ncbi:MAG: aminoacetone oxidase family FAD-binding enzyme [Planctomycetes bacterium]|nr:aminoacetone oxidase family FAD-binding enzyme [Planctomycetota bacterium]